MKKNRGLLKYKIKLSLIFSISIFIVLLISELIFIGGEYIRITDNLKDKLLNRYSTVETILKNKDFYDSESSDKTLGKLIEKGLDNSIIIKNDEIIDNFPLEISKQTKQNIINQDNETYIDLGDFLIFQESKNNIKIAVLIEKNYNSSDFVKELVLFILIDLLIFVLSFYIFYLFLNKILRKIDENVENLIQFTNDVNHELKTPLSIIKSSLQLFKKEGLENQNVDNALNATENIKLSLDAMLQMAIYNKGLSYEKQLLNIKKEIQKIIKIYEKSIKKKNLKMNIKLNRKKHIFINANHFLACVSNLIKNAIKFSYENGAIDIIIGAKSIEIKDYGVGIEKKYLDNIFSRHYTSDLSKGDGIGLSIVKKISDKNNWKISCSSEPGKLSSFTIFFN